MRKWKSLAVRWSLLTGLLAISFYTLRGETNIPDNVLESVKLLKKPIEDLLPDLQEADPTTPQAIQQATLDLEPYSEMQNNRERWNEMRALIENGQPLQTPLPSEIAISSNPVGHLAPAVPPPPGFTVQLPYESRLTVSGRKTIGMDYKATRYTNSTYATTQGLPTGQSSFELQQQLQVRINGQIGRKVTVNVDFDDTKQDKKDISIVYKGDPDEVVQRAAFGDINLTLPATEFAGYSKQVFGASAELKYKALHGYVIGSRTKGSTETKEFVGNVILQRLDIPDTSYIRRRYYSYKQLPQMANANNVNANTVIVYLDTQDNTRSPVGLSTRTVSIDSIPNFNQLPPSASHTYTGQFKQLAAGTDYTLDPIQGLITFRNVLTPNSVVAIDYNSTPTSFTGVALKWDETVNLLIPATEDLAHYNIGTTKIVRDNAQGNFVLQTLDLARNNIGAQVGIQYLPNNSGQIIMDFEQGVFYLTKQLPYAQVYQPTPVHQATFFVEYRSRVKTYTLRPNIVLNSEQISMNGRKLTRDVDYFIDYESGFITFFNEDQITEDTHIVASYDYSPFGIAGAQQDTLVGERTELSLYPLAPILGQSAVGSTVLYDFAPQQTAAPDIRQTAGSFLVTEGDLHLKDLIFNPIPMLKSSFSGEVAHSVHNINNFGKALIDNFEGIVDETSVGMSKLSWQISSNPAGTHSFANAIGIYHLDNEAGDNLVNELIPTLTINPAASALPGDQMQVLDVNYNLSQSTEASIATVLSPAGIDFSKKLYLQMWVQGDGTNAQNAPSGTLLNVTLGQISEDFDGTGVLKTEDVNSNNTLDVGEDIGIPYVNPDNSITQLGATNSRIDTNDLNRNGRLDTSDTSAGSGAGGQFGADNPSGAALNFGGASADNAVDFSGWKFVQVPLNISSATAASWTAVQEVRVTLKQGAHGGKSGLIKIAKLSVVGNKWLADDLSPIGSTVTSAAVNNEVNPNYSSPPFPDFNDLNQVNTALSGPQPAKRKEQSLAINYNLIAPSTAPLTGAVKSITTAPIDLTSYGSLRFFVYKNSSAGSSDNTGTLFFRAGTDTDYWEFDIPITDVNLPPNKWTEVQVDQLTVGKSQLAAKWTAHNIGTAFPSTSTVALPNLSSVSQFAFGVTVSTGQSAHNEIWIDDLHAGNVIPRTGNAARLGSEFEVFGWGKLALAMRDIDQNFQTFTSAITNQAKHETTADLSLNRLSWFPMQFSGLNRRTETPNITTIGNSTLVSVLQQGRVDERGYSGTGTLQLPHAPKLGLLYDNDKIQSAALFRTDKTSHYGVTMDYGVPGQHRLLPKNVQLGYKLTAFDLNFDQPGVFLTQPTDPFSISNTRDKTHDITAKMSFQPLPGFTLNPSLARTQTREEKDVIFSTDPATVVPSTTTLSYDKLKSQTLGIDGVMAFTRWFSPRVRYNIINRETFGIPVASSTTAQNQKSVDRTGTGEVAWDFAWRDFSKRATAFQSLNVVSSYLIEDGDTYDNVSAGKDSLFSFWIPNSLNDSTGIRRNLTLRDTIRSTQRWSPFDWAHAWSGSLTPLRTLSMTSTLTNTTQKQEVTGTPSKVVTHIYPDLIFSLTQTEYFLHLEKYMSNSQMNLKTQWKSVNTLDTSLEKATSNGGDWRFTLWKKMDAFFSYTRTTDRTDDLVNHVTSNDSFTETIGSQLGFNVGKWRITPKYDQSRQQAVDSSGRLTTDLTTRTPAVQFYADLFLPAGLRLPFGSLMVFSNRVRTTSTVSYSQKRSSLNALQNNTDAYSFSTSEDYELTSNMRLTVGGSYGYTRDRTTSDANFFSYELNSLLTIQF